MTWIFWTSYAVLWIVVSVLALSVVMMLREHAELELRSSEGRSRLHGPPEGTVAPPLGGEELHSATGPFGRPRMVLFMSVECQPCITRRPQISHFAADQFDAVETVVCCAGRVDQVREFAKELGPEVSVIADPTGDATAGWRVFMTPFAVGVNAENVVRGKVANPAWDSLTLLARRVLAQESPLDPEEQV